MKIKDGKTNHQNSLEKSSQMSENVSQTNAKQRYSKDVQNGESTIHNKTSNLFNNPNESVSYNRKDIKEPPLQIQ